MVAFGPIRGLSGHQNDRRVKRSDFRHPDASVWDSLEVWAQAFGRTLDYWGRLNYRRPAWRALQAVLAPVSDRTKVEKGHAADSCRNKNLGCAARRAKKIECSRLVRYNRDRKRRSVIALREVSEPWKSLRTLSLPG